jgi:hypothetical protein
MANEATLRVGLTIRKSNLQYQNQPQAFLADIESGKGPYPGALTVTTSGRLVDLTEIVTPGFCVITNTDSTHTVSWGIYDASTDKNYMIGDLLPGEACLFRMHQFFEQDYAGTGTGTGTPSCQLLIKSETGSPVVKVEVFEK